MTDKPRLRGREASCQRPRHARPQINLNGTHVETLRGQNQEAMHKLNDARNALLAITVHGRDYLIQGPFANNAAIDPHHDRIAKVRAVHEVVATLMDSERQLEDRKS